jgi:hypothetical protein
VYIGGDRYIPQVEKGLLTINESITPLLYFERDLQSCGSFLVALMAERKNMSNIKNYTEQGGEKTIIGGTLVITEDGTVEGLLAESLTDSTATTIAGLVVISMLAKRAAGHLITE